MMCEQVRASSTVQSARNSRVLSAFQYEFCRRLCCKLVSESWLIKHDRSKKRTLKRHLPWAVKQLNGPSWSGWRSSGHWVCSFIVTLQQAQELDLSGICTPHLFYSTQTHSTSTHFFRPNQPTSRANTPILGFGSSVLLIQRFTVWTVFYGDQ